MLFEAQQINKRVSRTNHHLFPNMHLTIRDYTLWTRNALTVCGSFWFWTKLFINH